ncbi:hypothetical protein EK21DRAFT_95564 [Setomelanomma holmii]|uniref:Uncharacterized protein n=1 Tax=Setomelanomma holmii TaxID=210430 RepID=A0A9P4LFV1_9PLEO|nr:hypothetical protein EK21DRAFT_95564 [Setomelanomma holmii]
MPTSEIAHLKAVIAQLKSTLKTFQENCHCVANNCTSESEATRSSSNDRRPTAHDTPSLRAVRDATSVSAQSPPSANSRDGEGLQIIPFEAPTTSLKKRARRIGATKLNSAHYALRSFISSVKSNQYNTNFKSVTITDREETVESAYDYCTKLAKYIVVMLNNNESMNGIASTRLFNFLTLVYVLRELRIITPAQVDKLMAHLDPGFTAGQHRQRSLNGVGWFHKHVISELCNQGWELVCSIAVVAINAPHRLHQYESIASRKNKEPILKALQGVEDKSQQIRHLGLTLIDSITRWESSISQHQVLTVLYPGVSLLNSPTQNPSQLHLQKKPNLLETTDNGTASRGQVDIYPGPPEHFITPQNVCRGGETAHMQEEVKD